MAQQAPKKLMLYCEPCAYKRLIMPEEQISDLVEIPSVPIPGGAPVLKPGETKAKPRPQAEQPKKYKCPKCGRGVRVKEMLAPYAKAVDQKLKVKEKEERDKARLQRIKDGQPPERNKDDE